MQLTIHNTATNEATHIMGESLSLLTVCTMFDMGAANGTKFHLTLTHGSTVACAFAAAYAMPHDTNDSLTARFREFCRSYSIKIG